MNELPVIACDLDGVLNDPLGPLMDWINMAFGCDIDQIDVTDWDNVLNVVRNQSGTMVSDEAWNACRRGFWTSNKVLADLPVMLPMLTALARVRGMAKSLHIVTERGDETLGMTRAWLDGHGVPYDRIALRRDKAAYCREQRIRYIVEDDPEIALSCHNVGVGVFLIDQPYNRNVPPLGGIWRIFQPNDIPGLLERDLYRSLG